MLVLGIDPGTAIVGYGLVRELSDGNLQYLAHGTIQTPSQLNAGDRLAIIYDQLMQIINLHRPDCGAVEKLFFQKNVTTAMAVSQARGVILLAFSKNSLPFEEYTPMEIKQTAAGFGGATKRQVQEMVKLVLGMDEIPQPDDAADALAIAICHIQNWKIRKLLKEN
ncbi:MAG: crossover junction endodeoxyribonuclease RuvC [Anaerolineaceae bacterium]|nr:crossover junction endodeoxyribonuclease RuvC [Anaerolineaceae bacterium]